VKIAFITPELQSLVRRTNLAEIAECLPRTLRAAGHDVRVFMPHTVDVRMEPLTDLTRAGEVIVPDESLSRNPATDVPGKLALNLVTARLGELPIVLLQHAKLFGERHPYGDENGPYPDNWRRYAAFARGVLRCFEVLGFEPDVLHCMDWTSGLVPLYRELEFVGRDPEHPVSRAGVFLGIHNLAMQGSFEREILPKVGLPHQVFQDVRGVTLEGRVNYLKTGAEFAHLIGTSSPAMASRVQQIDRGYGLEETFKRRGKDLVGIVGGIDYSTWDPTTDKLLPATYDAKDTELAGKRRCKASLQKALGLDVGTRTPVAAVLGRFDSDSGFDLLAEVMTEVLERNFELVLMGSGQPEILERIKTVQATFGGRCRLIEGYNTASAHALLGGADLLLLPSHYHPSHALCAIGMRYGAVPLVYSHSGLEDTVFNYVENKTKGTGFVFHNYSGDGLLDGLDEARLVWKDATRWKRLAIRCMRQDFSWEATAKEYLKAYRRLDRRVKAQLSKT
jgi:starch synthase